MWIIDRYALLAEVDNLKRKKSLRFEFWRVRLFFLNQAYIASVRSSRKYDGVVDVLLDKARIFVLVNAKWTIPVSRAALKHPLSSSATYLYRLVSSRVLEVNSTTSSSVFESEANFSLWVHLPQRPTDCSSLLTDGWTITWESWSRSDRPWQLASSLTFMFEYPSPTVSS